MAVYPRWRGEHGLVGTSTTYADGLSPLARGTLRHAYTIRVLSRCIPAGAGNTTNWSEISHMPPVYPRWRGEHVRFLAE